MARGITTNLNPQCKYCGQIRKNDNARMNHERFCEHNPNREISPTKGKPGSFRGKTHTQETKDKISRARLKYLNEHPEQVPYKLNHYSKGRSYPEEYWKIILETNGINFVEQFPVGLYQLDFALVDSKIDLEIDGDQHYLDKRIVESDKKRTEFLETLGWTIIRVKWSDFQRLSSKKEYVRNIIFRLTNLNQNDIV